MIYWYVLLWVALFSCLIISFLPVVIYEMVFLLVLYQHVILSIKVSLCNSNIQKKIVEKQYQIFALNRLFMRKYIRGTNLQSNGWLYVKNKCCNQHSVGLLAYVLWICTVV